MNSTPGENVEYVCMSLYAQTLCLGYSQRAATCENTVRANDEDRKKFGM